MADVQAYIPEVISAHFDEAMYLYSEYQIEINASELDTAYLNSVTNRIDANLDGLKVNAIPAWAHCEEAMDSGDDGAIFVAAYLAFHLGDLEKIKLVANAGQSESNLLNAVAFGLAWHPWLTSGFWATKFTSAKQTTMAAIGLFCFYQHDKASPIHYESLLKRSLDNDAQVELPLLLSLGRQRQDLAILPLLQQNSTTDFTFVQFDMLRTRLGLGDASALIDIKQYVLNDNDYREPALDLAFPRLTPDEAKQWMGELKNIPGSERYLVLAVGAMNEVSLTPWIVKQMAVPELARISGKVFSRLTGADLRKKGWVVSDDSMDEQWLSLEGDEELDWPDVAQIKKAMNYV